MKKYFVVRHNAPRRGIPAAKFDFVACGSRNECTALVRALNAQGTSDCYVIYNKDEASKLRGYREARRIAANA